jgi:hypothetical protein
MSFLQPLSAALLAFLLAAPARAQEMSSIELIPSTTQAVLASPLELSVTARVPSEYELKLDTSSQSLEPFDILGLEKVSTDEKDGRKTERWKLTIVPLAAGDTTFPELDWTLQGRGERTLKSPPVPLTVVPPPDLKDHPDILDLRVPIYIIALWPWLAALLLALVAAFALWRRLRRPGSVLAADEGPQLTPEEEAEKALAALLAERLFERGETRTFYDRLSGIVRTYLEVRHGIASAFMTTYDINRHLKKAAIDRGGASAVRDLLDACDLAKFAKVRPTAEEKDRDVARARRVFTPPAPAAAADALAQKGRAA